MTTNVAIEDLKWNLWGDVQSQIKYWREESASLHGAEGEIRREEFEAYVSERHPEFALEEGEVVWEHAPVEYEYEVQGNYGDGWEKLARYSEEIEAIEGASRLTRGNPHNGYRVVKKVVK